MASGSKPLVVIAALGALQALLPAPGAAQEELRRPATSLPTLSLNSSADVRLHYDQLQRTLRRLSTDELERLYVDYTAALAELSAENAQRLAALFAENQASHATLRGEDIASAERSQRSQEIQNTYATAGAELRAWYADSQRALTARYESDRNARRIQLDSEISALSNDMNAAVARLRAGAGTVAVPAEIQIGNTPAGLAIPDGAAIGIVTPNC